MVPIMKLLKRSRDLIFGNVGCGHDLLERRRAAMLQVEGKDLVSHLAAGFVH